MYKNSRMYMPTYILIAVNLAVYGFTAYLSGNPFEMDYYSVIRSYGQYNPDVFSGQVWRLLTAMFVHANIAHIAGNMLFLAIFGLRAEDMFDLKEYLLIYFLSGFAGGFLTLLMGPSPPSVGASGAIFGMFGATIIYARRAIGQSIMSALLYSFFLFAINIGPNVNVFAHFGGLVAGLLIGYSLAAKRKPAQVVTYQYSYPTSYGDR